MQRQIPPGRAFSCLAPTLAPNLAALNVSPNVCEGTLRQIPPHRQRGGGQRLHRRRYGLAPAGRAQCGREQRGHPRRLAYSSDFSQWLVNNIPTLASRLNGLSIGHRRLLAFLRRYSRVIDVNEVRLQAHPRGSGYTATDRKSLTIWRGSSVQ